MSLRRAILLLGVIIGIVIIASFAVWYFVRPEIQFFIYWVVGIIVAVFVVLAAIVQITGYSLRDFLQATIRTPKLYTPELPTWYQTPSFQRVDASSAGNKETLDELLSNLTQDTSNRLAIIGKSGCGKTMALHAMARKLSSRDNPVCHGVYIPLGTYAHSLPGTIKSNIGWQSISDDRVLKELEKLGAVLLFDGLNEVPGSQREQCRNEIQSLMRAYPCGIVVSFPSADRVQFGFDCPTYEILPLTAPQIREIVTGFFTAKGESKKAEWFLDRFSPHGEFQPEFLQLSESPLNLQFLLELGSENQFDLQSIRDLYGQVLERRLSRLERQERKGKFPPDVKKECLADVAVQSLVDDSGPRMSKAFTKSIFSKRLPTVEASEILTEVVQSGLLNEIGDRVQWFHSSLRDYLVGYRMYTLANSNQAFEFPIEKPHWTGAVAYAVGLSTQPIADQPVSDLLKRPAIFRELLQRTPASETVRAVIKEYHLSGMRGDCTDRKCTEDDFKQLQWGERFLDAYREIASIAQRENAVVGERIPNPMGLRVLTNSDGHFCALVFSCEQGLQFGHLDQFDGQVTQSVAEGRSCAGFCLHGWLLPQIDPEVVAYFQISTWLKLVDHDNSGRYMDWLQDAATCGIITPDEWVDWQQQKIDVATNVRRRGEIIPFAWQDFYAPLSFCIDPDVTPSGITYFATRTGALRLTRLPASQINVAFLSPFSPKTMRLDRADGVYIPFPSILLNRDYFVHAMGMSYTRGGSNIIFVHLRG